MSLLGNAAMVLSFNIVPDALDEHDDWHSHEHLQERLSIPGFLRGTRWVSLSENQKYFVMYEVTDLDTLSSQRYLERLNNPSPWTSKIMKYYRGMNRGFCRVTCRYGQGLGSVGMLIRFTSAPEKESVLREWLCHELLNTLPSMPGLISTQLLEAAQKPEFTEEQRIRGKDGPVDWVLLVTGYSAEKLMWLTNHELSIKELEGRGAEYTSIDCYQLRHALTADEIQTSVGK